MATNPLERPVPKDLADEIGRAEAEGFRRAAAWMKAHGLLTDDLAKEGKKLTGSEDWKIVQEQP